MEQLFGRKKEIEIFNDALASNQSEFIAVKGRRRIGKTFLVNTFFKEERCFLPMLFLKKRETLFAKKCGI
jgi:AAA+ ATPase superfamily predicted ATPase